jgi:hypothetical protein
VDLPLQSTNEIPTGGCEGQKEMLVALKKRRARSEPIVMLRTTFCSILNMILFLKIIDDFGKIKTLFIILLKVTEYCSFKLLKRKNPFLLLEKRNYSVASS